MPDLMPLTALGGPSPRVETYGAVTISENAGLALASLAVPRGQSAPKLVGLQMPDVGKIASNDAIGAFWTGPGRWMIEGEGQAETDFASVIAAEAGHCSVTEQTDGFVCFEVNADADTLENLLAKLINIDPRALSPGCAVRTGLEHMTVFVLRRSADQLAILGMRSFANTLWHALTSAAAGLDR